MFKTLYSSVLILLAALIDLKVLEMWQCRSFRRACVWFLSRSGVISIGLWLLL